MKVLCKDSPKRRFRKFIRISNFADLFECIHCHDYVNTVDLQVIFSNPKEQLKNHTCKARLKELNK